MDLRRLILSRRAAFLTLCLIVALGLGGFLASQRAGQSMKNAAADFYRERRFWDFEIVASLGVSEEDVAHIRALPETAEAEGKSSAEARIILGDSARDVLAVSLTEHLSVPVTVSGRLPAEPGECALEPDVLEAIGAAVGDVIELVPATGSNAFQAGKYLVCGTVIHPDYVRRDTADVVVLPKSAFLQARYSRIAVLAAGTEEMNPFSDAYAGRISEVRETLVREAGTLGKSLPAGLAEQLRCIVLDRDSNAGYVNYTSVAGAYSSAGMAFGFLFLLVIALECFSTVAVIVEEEKRVIGVGKAFGFSKPAILHKYFSFGIGAACTGSVLGIGLSFALSGAMLSINERTNLYAIIVNRPAPLPALTVAVCGGTAAVCAMTACLSCLGILRSPAELLLKGAVQKKARRASGGRNESRTGLYFRMILRNSRSDLSRVILSIAVVTVSCILIGSGVTVKLAHDGANQRQLSEVLLYDLRVGVDEDVGEETRAALEEKLNELGVQWCPVLWGTQLFDNGGQWDGVTLIRGSSEQLGMMIGLADPSTGEKQTLGDAGALIQLRMTENLHLSPGDTLTVLDKQMKRTECPVAGSVVNYSFRMMVMNRTVYDRVFGTDVADNAYLVLLNGMDDAAFRDALLSVSDGFTFERSDSFFEQYKSIAATYNIVVLSITGISVMISFVILINLANIYISRKKRELVILRMNGFSVRMCKAYVAYDAILTTVVGLVLGVLGGIPVAARSVHIMEREYFQFVRSIQPVAWLFAVVAEALFAVVIYGSAMRKIRYYEIGDLADTK